MMNTCLAMRLKSATALGSVLLLLACSTNPRLATLLTGYPGDSTKACYAERASLNESGKSFGEDLLWAAAVGAAGGALVQGLRGENILVGVVVGAAAAMAGTYLIQLQTNGLSSGQLVGQVIGDVEEENRRIDVMQASFQRLRTCRLEQGRQVQADLDTKRIDRSTAEARMAEARALYQQDIERAKDIADKIGERSTSYVTAYNQIAADNNANGLVVADYKPQPVAASSGRSLIIQKSASARAEPTTKSAIVARLPSGERVTSLRQLDAWHEVRLADGRTAYVASSMLGSRAPSRPATSSAQVSTRPPERPIPDKNRVQEVKLEGRDRRLVGELQEDCVTNVAKRDECYEQVEQAKLEEQSLELG